MWTRREALRAGLVLAGSFAADAVSAGAGQTRPRSHGCMLSRDEARLIMRSATEQRVYESGHEPIIANSDDRDFDLALAQMLSKISDEFAVLPGFAYYDDYGSPNAFATTERRLQRADGTVLFGQRLLKRLLATRENPDVAVAAVCAHEFGHILQYKRGLIARVTEGQATIKRAELQADFFAGYFAGARKRERPDFPAAVFALTQYNSGDNMIKDPDHHGTHDERGAAISQGFDAAYRDRLSLSAAIEASISYVTRL